MKISIINRKQTQKGTIFCCLFEKFRINTKFLLPLLLLFGLIQGVFAQGSLQPAVNIFGPLEACAKTPTSNTSGDMTLDIDIARSGVGVTITYFIDPLLNSSGAFIRSIGPAFYQTIDTDPLPGPDHNTINHTYQTIVVYPGTTGQGFNILVTAINNQSVPPTTASASKSVSVSELSADSSHTPILCYGGLSTLTAEGHLSDTNGYTYTLLPSGPTNTTGLFGDLPGSVAGITYTIEVVSAEGCIEYTSQTITQPADNPVVLNCPENGSIGACSTQDQVNAAFNVWLNSFSFSGGSNTVMTRTPSSPNAPPICGGSVEVRWDVTQSCYPTATCSRTFTVGTPTPATLSCGENVTMPACSTQAAVNAAWTAFKNQGSSSGGCNGSLTNNAGANPPPICGGSVEVTWTYTSSCEAPKTCTRSFTVTAVSVLAVTCPGNKTVACGENAATLFAQWKAGFTYTGGCSPVTATDLTQYQLPAAGVPLVIQYTVSDGCQSKNCSSTFLVPVCNLPKGCSLGFWKTHPQVWDQTTDPVAASAGFRTTTNFWTFMGLPAGSCGLPTSFNMLQAVGINAGGCKALTRQGVAALLGSAAFGNNYAYPSGTTNFATLKALLVNALSTCNCPQSLIDALNAANNNEYDINGNNICSPLGRLVSRADMEDKAAIANFDAYPVPFKDKITIKYQFDFNSDVKIEIINLLGMTVYTQNDANGYMGKEIDLDLNSNVVKEQIYFIKLTTSRGSILKKVMSSK